MKKTARSMRYGAIAGIAALVLSSCGRDIDVAETEVSPGATVTAMSQDGSACEIDVEGEMEPAVSPVTYGIGHDHTQKELSLLPTTETGQSSDDGSWEVSLTAPEVPGPYAVIAQCEEVSYPSWQYFHVLQPELNLAVSSSAFESGETITAEANWCRAENDYGFADLVEGLPVMTFLLDGEEVDSITAQDAHPTGSVTTEILLTESAEHEITAICEYPGVATDDIPGADSPTEEEIRAALTSFDGELSESVSVEVTAKQDSGSETDEEAPDKEEQKPKPVKKQPSFTG